MASVGATGWSPFQSFHQSILTMLAAISFNKSSLALAFLQHNPIVRIGLGELNEI